MTLLLSPESVFMVAENKISDAKPPFSMMKWISENWRAVFGELLATCMMIFFGCMSCIPMVGLEANPVIYSPLTFGLTVMFCIQAYGHISGAHMNPVVTVASIIWGDTSIPLGVLYVIVQCAGATLGYWMLMYLSPEDLSQNAVCVTLPRVGLSSVQALAIEVALTAALILMCCGVWDPVNHHNQDSVPLRFGFTVAALSMTGGPLTGASMNPARSLGPALLTGAWRAHWVYWVGPLVGGISAVLLYKTLFITKPPQSSEEHQQPLNVT